MFFSMDFASVTETEPEGKRFSSALAEDLVLVCGRRWLEIEQEGQLEDRDDSEQLEAAAFLAWGANGGGLTVSWKLESKCE